MIVSKIKIECNNISNWETFHKEFSKTFGFPEFYGNNMDAWIDCMTSIDSPSDGMSKVHCDVGKVLTIELNNAKEFKKRCLELYEAIIECSAFVNWRRIDVGEEAVLALSFNG